MESAKAETQKEEPEKMESAKATQKEEPKKETPAANIDPF